MLVSPKSESLGFVFFSAFPLRAPVQVHAVSSLDFEWIPALSLSRGKMGFLVLVATGEKRDDIFQMSPSAVAKRTLATSSVQADKGKLPASSLAGAFRSGLPAELRKRDASGWERARRNRTQLASSSLAAPPPWGEYAACNAGDDDEAKEEEAEGGEAEDNNEADDEDGDDEEGEGEEHGDAKEDKQREQD
ncbi:hypothetical protein TGME49_256950 [Toxoplasma gondii ME49]|uniref:Uncharacterized protein n=4 Tax=Toxoplasma gondii TaxID=5811 RepID=A0A125YMC8_TOXGV|nr:hypothetical protein TGME49_256950 [Toxoplasma gondii ME49]EPT29224.1 hypothetical protein TGME49_256950 [Toxoplasma gondii ME49]ESS28633.1 hypothetical protein TGVEG_256950 [Toxoplasma gondii VEG]KYF45766.1 hypothetical protein TGARI_256950 [Toxoplasma gondii ARI]PIM03599.1 hypothetical protein TGCOUG_256950 [Toxoplasma gondii COUG]|eukprot:XP_002364942.2 hypothetical protein TGME49_256950 [Toxoplasma gondii ME49]